MFSMVVFANLFSFLIVACWLIGVIASCYFIFYLFRFKGDPGEQRAAMLLNKLPKDKYTVFNDIMIEVDGETHQIDHIVTRPYGIFVIETKNYNGDFVGSRYTNKWKGYYSGIVVITHNPIMQNHGHILAISKLMGIDTHYFINLVCTVGRGRFRVHQGYELCTLNTLIKRIYKYNRILFNDVSVINRIIEIANITDNNKRVEHIRKLRDKYGKNKKLLL